jgi:dimethylglycine catabolism B
MLIEQVDAIVGMRRSLTLQRGELPARAAQTLDNLRQTATVGGFSQGSRYYWAIDLGVKTIAPSTSVDVLLWAGEGAFDLRYQRTLRALVKVLKNAKVDFAVLNGESRELEQGLFERDCGDTARRLGDEATFQQLAKANIEMLNTLKFKRILTADPHVLHSLKNEYPAFGGNYKVVHHTTFLAELASSGKLRFNQSAETRALTYHDPCYLARYNGEVDAPRVLLRKMGIEVSEMERNSMRGRCCGGGGGAPISDVPSLVEGSKRIPDIRIADARNIGAAVVAVACPQCTAMLEGVVDKPEILDIAELVANAMEVAA